MAYRPCTTAEADIGMRYYMCDTGGTGGRIKAFAEDFVVDEISSYPPEKEGEYVIARVTSTNWETNRMVRMMSRSMGISRERIGFAGTKDKRAVTSQLMSFKCSPEVVSKINLKDLDIKVVGRSARPMRIGDLIGNSFRIKVRECDVPGDEIARICEAVRSELGDRGGFPNYFGVQRFGTIRPITHRVGEALVRGNTEEAVRIYLSAPSEFEDETVTEARERLADGDYSEIVKDMPKNMDFERTLAQHLSENPGDYAGAISSLPSNLQMMFTHAYQSYIFNMMLSERMTRGLPLDMPIEGDTVIPKDADGIPLHEKPVKVTGKNIDLAMKQVRTGRAFVAITIFGSDSTFSEGEMGDIERKVMDSERIKAEDFLVVGLPNCSSKGSSREILCPIGDLDVIMDNDGYTASFSLPKGNYATCVMREFMKSNMTHF